MGGEGPEFWVRFWGVRGTVPCPGPETLRYGGNTACVEVMCGKQRLIFDAGTGLRVLGAHLNGQKELQAHLFLTHTHIDHINGFPFFRPAYSATTGSSCGPATWAVAKARCRRCSRA